MLNDAGGAAIERTHADHVSVPLTDREDDHIIIFDVSTDQRWQRDLVDNFRERPISKDVALSIKFKEKVPHDPCEHQVPVLCLIADGPGFSLEYLLIGAKSFWLLMQP